MVDRMQPGPIQPRVFISYARSDGEPFASELRTLLQQQGIPLWQDRVKMEGGRDWWLQIVDALNTVEFMVMVMTPAALQSPIVRKEWRYARQQGVCVYPVKAVPDLDFHSVPRWMSSVHWYDLAAEHTKFLNDLNHTCEKTYVPFMVGDLPGDFVERPGEFRQLREKLLDEKREEPIAITAALRGAGGYGKTTMARALCHDERIEEAFDDGILWVTLGEKPGHLIGILGDLIYALSREKPALDTLDAATHRLGELLADRDILLVIDDVWDAEHLKPFLQGGKRCARLVTTRNEQVLPSEAERITVDAMQPQEAVDLLQRGLEDATRTSADMKALQTLVGRLGKWPLLLKLVNGILHARVQSGESLSGALAFVNDALDEEGLAVFDDENAQDRHRAVTKTLSISLQLLTAAQQERYRELAIFPEDVDIPLATLSRFWQANGGMNRIKVELLCQRLAQLSLLLEFDLARRTIRLHDVIRSYLRHSTRDVLPVLNGQFLDAYKLTRWSDLPLDEPYLWRHLAEYLIDAERATALLTTVRDGNYLVPKTHLRGAYAVETDIALAGQHNPKDPSLPRLNHLFRGISHLLNQCVNQHELASTLHAYLSSSPEFTPICTSIEPELAHPFLTAQHPLPDLPSPALIRTLQGHTHIVNGCAVSPDGEWLVSCSDDQTLNLTLRGHSDGVRGCAVSPDGEWIVSGSDDKTLKLWDVSTGQERLTLQGHTDWVNGCTVSPDGKWIVSCSDDQTLKVWDARSGQERLTLRGHSDRVNGCAVSPDGLWLVSCSFDQTLKVWDARTGQQRLTLRGHTSYVIGCAVSPDGQWIVSCSFDQTIKLWDARTGNLRASLLVGASLWTCAFCPDGQHIVAGDNGGVYFLRVVW